MAEFKYFGITVMSQKYIHEKIKIRLNFGACYHEVQNILPSHLRTLI
jgi:hypothetical protein